MTVKGNQCNTPGVLVCLASRAKQTPRGGNVLSILLSYCNLGYRVS